MLKIEHKILCLLLFLVMAIMLPSSVLASEAGYATFPSQKDISTTKMWEIKFNMPLAQETLDSSQIRVIKDSDGQIMNNPPPIIQTDGNIVRLNPPQDGYAYNTEYTLIIENIKSSQGIMLKQAVKMGFTTIALQPAEGPTVSPGNPSITTDDNITISLGDYVLEEETTLTVTPEPVEEDNEAGYKIVPYDIKLGNMSKLDDFITIRIPYDESYCEPGQDASRCVGAKYKNENTGEWEDVLYEVDAKNKELVIYTDHLSIFGVFYVRNEGMRSAYITGINEYLVEIAYDDAATVLGEYVAKGGTEGEEAVSLGASLISDIFDLSGSISSGTDIIANPVTIASLGNPVFESALADKAYDKLGQLGKAASIVRIGSTVLKSDASDEDILNLYKDVAFYAIGSIESAALGLAMSGVWIFDYTISSMFEQGMQMKMDKMGEIYRYFNDDFNSGPYRARTMKDWRQVLIDIVEKNPGDEAAVKAALEAEIERYARVFWDLDLPTVYEVVDSAGYTRMPYPSNAEIEVLVKNYKLNLYERLYPVCTSVRNYMQQKVHAEYMKALSDMRNFYNQAIELTVMEEGLPSGSTSKYAGYTMRLGSLADKAVKDNWTAVVRANGSATLRFTLLGFIQAGSPNKVELYAPGDKPDQDEPELEIEFTLKAPRTAVKLSNPGNVITYEKGSYSKTSDAVVGWAMGTALAKIKQISINPDGTFSASLDSVEDSYSASGTNNRNTYNIRVSNFIINGNWDATKNEGNASASFNVDYLREEIAPLQASNPQDIAEYISTYDYKDSATTNQTLSKTDDGKLIIKGTISYTRIGNSKLQYHAITSGKETWGSNPSIIDKSGNYSLKSATYTFDMKD